MEWGYLRQQRVIDNYKQHTLVRKSWEDIDLEIVSGSNMLVWWVVFSNAPFAIPLPKWNLVNFRPLHIWAWCSTDVFSFLVLDVFSWKDTSCPLTSVSRVGSRNINFHSCIRTGFRTSNFPKSLAALLFSN